MLCFSYLIFYIVTLFITSNLWVKTQGVQLIYWYRCLTYQRQLIFCISYNDISANTRRKHFNVILFVLDNIYFGLAKIRFKDWLIR